jgi:exodeoxyribonuclease VII small subunit
MSFETKVKQLEEVVKQLESPELGIDEGVKLFDKGVKLSKECYEMLNETKGKISVIKKQLDETVEKPLKGE